jgi:hypothetical protein
VDLHGAKQDTQVTLRHQFGAGGLHPSNRKLKSIQNMGRPGQCCTSKSHRRSVSAECTYQNCQPQCPPLMTGPDLFWGPRGTTLYPPSASMAPPRLQGRMLVRTAWYITIQSPQTMFAHDDPYTCEVVTVAGLDRPIDRGHLVIAF